MSAQSLPSAGLAPALLAALAGNYVVKKLAADAAAEEAKEAAKPLLAAMQAARVLKLAVDDETTVSVTAASTRTALDGKAAVATIEQLTATVQALASRLAALGEDVQLHADLGAVPYGVSHVAASLRVNRRAG